MKTIEELKESSKLMETLPTAIVSYYREPTDSKMRIILFDASRLRRLKGDKDYKVCVDLICVHLIHECSFTFINHIEQELLTVKI